MAVTEAGHPTRVAHAGTFTANPLTMAAGKATLDALTPEVFDRLNAEGVRGAARRCARRAPGVPLQVAGAGSLFENERQRRHAIVDHRSSLAADAEWEETASLALLCDGFFLTTRLHGCLSTGGEGDRRESLRRGRRRGSSAVDVSRVLRELQELHRGAVPDAGTPPSRPANRLFRWNCGSRCPWSARARSSTSNAACSARVLRGDRGAGSRAP